MVSRTWGHSGYCSQLWKGIGRSAADANVAHPPGIAIPEALMLPIAGAGRARVIGIAGRIVAGATIAIARTIVIRAGCDRATNDRAADQSGGEAGPPAAAPGKCRGGRRNGQGGNR